MRNHIIMYNLLVLDRNVWNHITVCKQIKRTIKKNAMEYEEYSLDCNI